MNNAAPPISEFSILEDLPRIKEDDTFQFLCGKQLACFNQCCRDVTIVLTPFDVLRLKHRLGMSSSDFLDRFALIPFSKQQPFPLVLLKMTSSSEKTCPFVNESGCQVYEDRPWACRMYPIGSALPSKDVDEEEFFFVIQEPWCQGHLEETEWSVKAWKENQGAFLYEEMGEEFKEISLHETFRSGKHLEPAKMEMLFTVLYDLDKFRRFVFESSFLKKFKVPKGLVNRARESDQELLRLGFLWLKFCLFGEQVEEIQLKKPKSP